MTRTVEFYFDLGSPTAYLAHKRLRQLSAEYDLAVRYLPMLLVAFSRPRATPHPSPSLPRQIHAGTGPAPVRPALRVTLQVQSPLPINTLNPSCAVKSPPGVWFLRRVRGSGLRRHLGPGTNMGDPAVVSRTAQGGLTPTPCWHCHRTPR